MKPIIVKDQVRLSPARCAQLALSGMGYRMFRSAITVTILALAVAFLVHMVAHSLLSYRVTMMANEELSTHRLLGKWVARLSVADLEPVVIRNLARAADNDQQEEYQRWSGATAEEMKSIRADAKMVQEFESYLNDIPKTTRVVLTGGQDTLTALRGLETGAELDKWVARLPENKVPVPLGSKEKFSELAGKRMPRLNAFLERVRAGHVQAIAQVRGTYNQKTPLALLSAPPADMDQTVQKAGFALQAGSLQSLKESALADMEQEHLARMIQPREVRDVLAKQLGKPVALINQQVVMEWATSLDRAQWLATKIEEKTGDKKLAPERILALAQLRRRISNLQAVAGEGTEAGEDVGALPTATLWLIGLSFLVCVVGVANAMLMSVTERFAEIATMKCLGAMDTFVMMMFLFEAMLQGFFGGLAGVVLGLILAVLRVLVEAGGLVWPALDVFGQVMLGAAVSLVAGVILAAVAAVWPAWVASRLAPMEAMRVE